MVIERVEDEKKRRWGEWKLTREKKKDKLQNTDNTERERERE